VSCEGEAELAARLGELDQVLTWLWRVHGIDYYGGSELLLEVPYATRAASSRTIRGPRPEEGEEQDEEEGEPGCREPAAGRGLSVLAEAAAAVSCREQHRPSLCAPPCTHPTRPPAAAGAAAAKADLADLTARVDSKWRARIESPDPLLLGAQREEVRAPLCCCWVAVR
jgi:hypothetical protein